MVNGTNYKELIDELKKYLTLQVDYSKLTVVEKMAVLFSAASVAIIVCLLAICILFYLSMALVQYLSDVMGCSWGANLIVAALYVLLLLAVIAFKKQLIVDPVAKFLSKLFLKPNE